MDLMADGVQTVPERRAALALTVAASAMLLVSFVATASNIAVPVLEKDFPDSSLTTLSWVVSGFNVTQATMMLLGGRLADRLGRRRVFLVGMAVFAVGALASGVAPGVGWIIAARVVQALGVALVLPSSLAAVLPLYPTERHAAVVSMWSSMGVLGATAAPTLVAGLLQVSGWRSVFLIAAPIAGIAWLAARSVLPNPAVTKDHGPLDVVGTVAGTVAVGALALLIVEGRFWGWTSPAIFACGALSAVAGMVFVRQSLHHPEPLIDLALFRVRSFTVVALAFALVSISTTATWFLYPLFMVQVWDYSIFQVGLAMTPGPLVMVFVSLLAGRGVNRFGYRTLLVIGALLSTLGTAWMASHLRPGASYATAFLPGTAMIGIGMGLAMGPANSAALRRIGQAKLGEANAVYNTLRLLGGALGVAIAAALLGTSEGAERMDAFVATWWTMVAAMALAPPMLWLLYSDD